MITTYDKVLQSAFALEESDRARLIEELLGKMEPENAAPLEDAWVAEIQRRSAEMDSGEVQGIPWETVRANARQKVFGHA